ncbi:MAG TPA: zinc metalloprotease HtpX [Drouetiella sp.]|jgi:heat shock protein HtpX
MNTIKTLLLMGCLTALIVAVGGVLDGRDGVMLAFFFAVCTNVFSYWFSAPIALKMSNAQPVSRQQIPELYDIVERIARSARIPVPSIYVIPTDSPNAFATGRDPEHSSIAVTEGIMRLLDWNELEGVLAHELAHVRNRDVLLTTIAAVLASVITTVAHYGFYMGGYSDDRREGANPISVLLMAILAPIAATLINLAISRSREFEADASGAELCGHPLELANALAKIDQTARAIPLRDANPALSSLYIIPPDPQSWFVNLMSTHPPTMERIARLKEMAARTGRA